jgi:uncharacterized protein
MQPITLFLNPRTKLLRSGWRVLLFCAITLLPRLITLFLSPTNQVGSREATFAADWAMVIVYCALIAWIGLVSWLCLYMLERLPFASLGYSFYSGWWRDVLSGCVIGALMILLVVTLQLIGGGTQARVNPIWSQNFASALESLCLASLLLVVAAAFEEIVFRGYTFQTLLRDVPAWWPITLLSLLFGIAHWSNSGRTLFSTINTVLAGIWLAVAYLKTHNLWFPTALHFSWNWTMGLFFGLPVSGMSLRPSLLTATSNSPLWLTGGSYGCEGGIAATLVFVFSTILIWRTNWLRTAPEMRRAWSSDEAQPESLLKLSLKQNSD